MSDPILAEDSTITKLVPSLEGILRDFDESATHHDHFVALLIVFLAESGFHVSCASNPFQSRTLRSVFIPKDWKAQETGIYEINFRLQTFPDVECKLIVVPSGDTLIVNLYPLMEEKKTYSIAVQSLKYVNPFASDLCGRYRNLKEISHRFKNALATPVRSDVLTRAGLTCPSLQGLPTELKLRILGFLDAYELTQMAQCCSEFRVLCSEPQLWKNLLLKDFPTETGEPIRSCQDFYRMRHKEWQRRLRRNEAWNTCNSSLVLSRPRWVRFRINLREFNANYKYRPSFSRVRQ